MSAGDEGQHTPLAAATTGGASAGAGTDGSFLRDRDPPPGYDGVDPETTFRAFEKSLKLWQFETDVPLRKQGAKLLRALTGAARLAVEELEYEQIASEDGIKNVVNRLREYFAPHLEVSMPRAFEAAVYGQPRQSKETYAEYVHRMQRNFSLLSKEGVDLPSGAKGYIIFRQSSLTEAHDQRVQTWCEGSYDEKVIIRSLRKLDKVIKEKSGKSHYVMEGQDEAEADEGTIGDYVTGPDQSDEEYIYVADGDLDVIYEEKDMVEAMASYQQVRQQLKEQRLGRGFYQGKGQRQGAKGKGFGKDGGKTRVHREHLKLRTRCWRCHQIGHISSECTNKPVSGEGAISGKASSQSSSAVSSKSGFFVATAEGGSVADPAFSQTKESSSFWLRSFVEQRAKTQTGSSETNEDYGARTDVCRNPTFCGIVTQAFEGVVDTAAEGGLIGTRALFDLECHLKGHGLQCQWTPKQSAAKGVGGSAVVKGVILIPLGIGGINGVLETTVVEGDVPLLLPIRLLKTLDAVVNIPKRILRLEGHGVDVCMRELHSGHMVISIMEFEGGRFRCPEPLQHQYDFHLPPGELEAMLVQQPKQLSSPTASAFLSSDRGSPHGAHRWTSAQLGSGTCGGSPKSGSGSGGKEGSPFGPCNSKLEGGVGQDLHHPDNGHPSKRHRGLVPRVLGAGIAAIIAANCGGDLCGVDRRCEAFAPTEVQRAPFSFRQFVYPSNQATEGRGQLVGLLDRVQGMPLEMGKSFPCYGGPPRGEGKEGLLEAEGGPRARPCGDGGGGYGRLQHEVPRSSCRDDGWPPEHRAVHEHALGDVGSGTIPEPSSCIQPGRHPNPADGRRSEASGCAAEGEGDSARGHVQDATGEDADDAGNTSHDTGPDGRSGFSLELDASRQLGPSSQERPQSGAVSLQPAGGAVHSEERRPTKGPDLLEVCPTPVQLLPLGSGGDTEVRGAQSQEESEDIQEQFLSGGPGVGDGRPVSNGAWVSCCSRPSRSWARRQQVRSLSQASSARFLCERKYQEKGEDGVWHSREGFVPLASQAELRIWAAETPQFLAEDLFENGRETAFTSKQRKALNLAVEKILQNPGIAEVFSPPRISVEGAKQGFRSSGSFDLETGWNLSDAQDRRAMWRHLQQTKPLLIILCPPCTMFSIMQELNFWKMDPNQVMMLLGTDLDHLDLTAAIAEWQASQGRYFLYEHPDGARSWLEPCIKHLQEIEGVVRARLDMCMFGMNVTGEGLNKKPTGILCNCPGILQMLDRQCDGKHFHVPLMGGIAHRAQKYPPAFCKAVVRGLQQQLRTDEAWFCGDTIYMFEEIFAQEGEGDALDVLDLGDESIEKSDTYQITQAEKDAVMKLHRNVGHPQKPEFIRFMRAGRVRSEVVRWAAKEFECDVCKAKQQPKAARPAAIPKSFQPNRVVGVDLIYIPEVGGIGTFPAVSLLDWGTNYQMVERVDSKHAEEVWDKIVTIWFRVFGPPEMMISDPGTEFGKEFQELAAQNGVIFHQTGARAPWQQGRTERHGGHYKGILEKARSEVVIGSKRELSLLMKEVEQAKNRYSNRSGFAPIQWQIGHWPRIPNAILSDNVVDPALVDGMCVDDMERLHQMRRVAQKAFSELNAKEGVQRALQARPRVWREYQAGDLIYVYRVPRARKRKMGGSEVIETGANKPTWVGPGTVIAPDGANLWVSMLGELWRVAREQCRPATNDEHRGVEMVMRECAELVDQFKRNANRAGYKDITKEGVPELEEVEEPAKRPRLEDAPVAATDVANPPPAPPLTGQDVPQEASQSAEEPELEGLPSTPSSLECVPTTPLAEGEEVNTEVINPAEPGVAPTSTVGPTATTNEQAIQNYQRAREQSQQMSDRLDGYHPRKGTRWVRGQEPYLSESHFWLADSTDYDEVESAQWRSNAETLHQLDFGQWKSGWQVDVDRKKLRRIHGTSRRGRFNPLGSQDIPLPAGVLGNSRRSIVYKKGKVVQEEVDNWRLPQGDGPKSWWCGVTEFDIIDAGTLEAWAAAKKGQDEVNLKDEPVEELEGWRQADDSEWAKIVASGAVKVLSLEESRQVRASLEKEGKGDRILPTKIARRYKPAEQPGEAPSKKSRLCIRGDLDPDILDLERFAPTITTANFNVMLQLAANEKMIGTIGDFKNAFCQSKPLLRANGQLYFQQPSGGISGLHPEQIVMIIAGCYGLVDAPLHWRKTLIEDLKALHYHPSKLDPCLWKLYHPETGKLEGVIAIEVDDLFTVGHRFHHSQMSQLREKYTFGKYVCLQEEPQGASFNGRRIQQYADGSFRIDMQKFIEERLHPVTLEKGRLVNKKAFANEHEVSMARATCGALNWLSKEGPTGCSWTL